MQQTRTDPTARDRVRHGEHVIEHLLRRAGFGASDDEIEDYLELGFGGTVRRLLDYEAVPDDVDALIGKPGYVAVTARGEFLPRTVINDSRQRWLFRMIHSRRPLQEKMTLFWHNHFATAYTKVVTLNGDEGARYMAAKPSEDPNQVKGQIELLREFALGNFRDLLLAIAKDTAMLVWLDGRTNVKGRPQENFARELMELFTMGVDTFAEADVYAERAFSPDGTSRGHRTLTTPSTTWRGSTTRARRTSRFRSIRTAARRFRRVRPTPASRTALT